MYDNKMYKAFDIIIEKLKLEITSIETKTTYIGNQK